MFDEIENQRKLFDKLEFHFKLGRRVFSFAHFYHVDKELMDKITVSMFRDCVNDLALLHSYEIKQNEDASICNIAFVRRFENRIE